MSSLRACKHPYSLKQQKSTFKASSFNKSEHLPALEVGAQRRKNSSIMSVQPIVLDLKKRDNCNIQTNSLSYKRSKYGQKINQY